MTIFQYIAMNTSKQFNSAIYYNIIKLTSISMKLQLLLVSLLFLVVSVFSTVTIGGQNLSPELEQLIPEI
jgi:hypothetical protein